MAEIVDRVFNRHGAPDAIIRGEEIGVATGFGLRYGRGELTTKEGSTRAIYWSGPSLGLDMGADAAKSFTLVYNLSAPDEIYRRFPGVDASAFFIGGVAVNYLQIGDMVLVPMRAGLGVRQGVSVGYLRFRDRASWVPF